MIRAVFQKDYFGHCVQTRLERSKTGHRETSSTMVTATEARFNKGQT